MRLPDRLWRALAWFWTHPLLNDRTRSLMMWALNAKFAAGVTAVVHNERGEVLLLEHAFRRRYPWALPGGWMGRHERPEIAVLREVKEETGLDVEVERLLTARTFPSPRLDVVYVCRLTGGSIRGSGETPRWKWCADGDYPRGVDPLDTRLGGAVATFDRALPNRVESSAQRRIYLTPEGRLLLDLTPQGRVRQLTLGRDRAVNDTWEPDTRDWTLDHAQRLARPYLPRDARLERSEPFVFRDRESGTRELYFSAALAGVFPSEVYAAFAAPGPPGACVITYYRTSAGGVAFLLVGLS